MRPEAEPASAEDAALRPSGVYLRSPAAREESACGGVMVPPFDPPAPEPSAAFDPFVDELVEALAHVAGAHAAEVRALLGEGKALPGVHARLVQAELVGEDGRALPRLVREIEGWRAILRGRFDDLGACGGRMLDEWSAEVLAAVLGQRALAPELRRELRQRGVCAFGLRGAA